MKTLTPDALLVAPRLQLIDLILSQKHQTEQFEAHIQEL